MKRSTQDLFAELLSIVDPAQREETLQRLCGDDEQRRNRLRRLLSKVAATEGDDAGIEEHAPLSKDDILGGFQIIERIGGGGFGDVYTARQSNPDRVVAVKVINTRLNERTRVAFTEESRKLARMQHPGICIVHHSGIEAPKSGSDLERPFFVMEYIDGRHLDDACDEDRLTLDQRITLMAKVCDALQYAHGRGIIHRDLKPENILVLRDKETGELQPKVIDFGIAKAEDAEEDATRGAVTRGYTSPEQASGDEVDARSDVYVLGVILYTLLVGEHPFPVRDADENRGLSGLQAEIARMKSGSPEPSTGYSRLSAKDQQRVAGHRSMKPGPLKKALGTDLQCILGKALAPDPEERYQTAKDLGDDLRGWMAGHALSAGPETARYRAGKFVRRNRVLVGLSSAFGLALLASLATMTWLFTEAESQRELAETQKTQAEEARAEATRQAEIAEAQREQAEIAQNSAEQERDRAENSELQMTEILYMISETEGLPTVIQSLIADQLEPTDVTAESKENEEDAYYAQLVRLNKLMGASRYQDALDLIIDIVNSTVPELHSEEDIDITELADRYEETKWVCATLALENLYQLNLQFTPLRLDTDDPDKYELAEKWLDRILEIVSKTNFFDAETVNNYVVARADQYLRAGDLDNFIDTHSSLSQHFDSIGKNSEIGVKFIAGKTQALYRQGSFESALQNSIELQNAHVNLFGTSNAGSVFARLMVIVCSSAAGEHEEASRRRDNLKTWLAKESRDRGRDFTFEILQVCDYYLSTNFWSENSGEIAWLIEQLKLNDNYKSFSAESLEAYVMFRIAYVNDEFEHATRMIQNLIARPDLHATERLDCLTYLSQSLYASGDFESVLKNLTRTLSTVVKINEKNEGYVDPLFGQKYVSDFINVAHEKLHMTDEEVSLSYIRSLDEILEGDLEQKLKTITWTMIYAMRGHQDFATRLIYHTIQDLDPLMGTSHQDTLTMVVLLIDLYDAWHGADPNGGYDLEAQKWRDELTRRTEAATGTALETTQSQ